MKERIIAHLDMDAFFAAIEEITTPDFLGKPIVVGANPNNGLGRGVVSTANYKARKYGIHSAMPISTAWQLSQVAKKQGKGEVIFLPVDFALYNKVSENIFKIIKNYSNNVEQASVDEFYFDLSFCKTMRHAEQLCQKIKKEVKQKEKLTCTIGIAKNKLIAKIAASVKKPDGIFVVGEKDVQNFLNPLEIRKIPGIGPKTAEVFYKKGIKIVKELTKFSREELKEMMGKHGESIYYKIKGIDEDPISQYREVKSIGEQTTFLKDTLEPMFIFEEFKKLLNNVFERFEASGFEKFKTVTITVRFTDFETKNSSKSLKDYIDKDNKKKFEVESLKLILPYLDKRNNPRRKSIRLVGLRIEKFK